MKSVFRVSRTDLVPWECNGFWVPSLLKLRAMALRRRWNTARSGSGCAAICYPAARGSLGDEAMLEAVLSKLQQRFQSFILLSEREDEEWSDIKYPLNVCLQPRKPEDWSHLASRLSGVSAFFHIGADILDGFYSDFHAARHLSMIHLSAALGVPTNVLGFSFRSSPGRRAVSAIGRLPRSVRLCSRDPVSLEQLYRWTGRRAEQVADVAFLLSPTVDSLRLDAIANWIAAARQSGGVIAGVNINVQVVEKPQPDTVNALLDSHRSALVHVLNQNKRFHVVLVPHDFRGANSDANLVAKLHDALSPELKKRCLLINKRLTPAEIKAVCALFDFTVTGRMHFAIASLGQTTPAFAFEYQEKFTGLYQLAELPNLHVPGDNACKNEAIVAALSQLIERHRAYREILTKTRIKLQRLAELNLALPGQ